LQAANDGGMLEFGIFQGKNIKEMKIIIGYYFRFKYNPQDLVLVLFPVGACINT
jgi:hypothetical protein